VEENTMELFVELKAEDKKNPYTCRREIIEIESKFKRELENNKEIKCAICGNKLLASDFRIAGRIYNDSKKVMLHPVHKTCIQEYTPIWQIASSNTNYKDVSDNDIIAGLRIYQVLHEKEVNGELPDFDETKSTSSIVNMTNPDVKGEPFYTMSEIKNGNLTGNIESYKVDNILLPVLYVSKKVAVKAKEIMDSSFENDYYVSGISKKYFNEMVKNFKKKFLVVMGFEGKKAISIPLTGSEIVEALEPNEWLLKIVEKSQ
jgi:hypothetical protein